MQNKQNNTKKRVGIIRGGMAENYMSSLKRGGEIILHISENLGNKYKPVDILIDKDYLWHCGGIPVNPGDLAHRVDIVWNTSHPSFLNILESLSIPNIGVSSFHRGLEKNREMLKEHIKSIGFSMPRFIISPKNAREVFEKISPPWIVNSKLVNTFPELAEAIENEKNILVEEFIPGKVASIHSVPMFRNEEIYVFPPNIIFGIFSSDEKRGLEKMARDLHKHIGAKHYLKSDFVLTPRGKVYLLQIDGMPDLRPDSHFSQVCESVGVQMHHVVEHILEQV